MYRASKWVQPLLITRGLTVINMRIYEILTLMISFGILVATIIMAAK